MKEPYVKVGLEEPRPAYDLIFEGEYIDESGQRKKYFWVWSQHSGETVQSKIILQPHETRVLVNTVWEPPKNIRYMQGGFVGRFAEHDLPTGIGIESPKK